LVEDTQSSGLQGIRCDHGWKAPGSYSGLRLDRVGHVGRAVSELLAPANAESHEHPVQVETHVTVEPTVQKAPCDGVALTFTRSPAKRLVTRSRVRRFFGTERQTDNSQVGGVDSRSPMVNGPIGALIVLLLVLAALVRILISRRKSLQAAQGK